MKELVPLNRLRLTLTRVHTCCGYCSSVLLTFSICTFSRKDCGGLPSTAQMVQIWSSSDNSTSTGIVDVVGDANRGLSEENFPGNSGRRLW